MFLHLSVILSGGGQCLPHCMLGSTPTPLGRPPQVETPSWADTPGSAYWDTQCPVHAGIDMATAADGTHPAGMHSCNDFVSARILMSLTLMLKVRL